MVIEMTVDLEELARMIAEKCTALVPTPKLEEKERVKIYGIRGLAGYIGCSVSKAQSMKNEGIIPYSEFGNRVFFYADEIDNALKR